MTNLSDFLKVKKVRCINDDYEELTIGRTYELLGVSEVCVKAIGNDGAEHWFLMRTFEPVLDSAENPLQKMELTSEFEAAETVLADNSEVNTQDNSVNTQDNSVNIQDTPKFKVGDPVYWGLKSRIFKVYRLMTTNVLQVELDDCVVCVHKDELCPATLENYGKLCSLFECIDFEAPPKPLSGDELVRAMLTKGIKNVLCLWGSGDKIIIDRLDYKGSLMSTNCHIVGGLTPIDWYTGEPLTEAVLDE